jgi:CBS domain-containing protein
VLVKEIITRNVDCVRPDTSIQDAARKTRELDVDPLPVCGDNDRLAGMVTDRDITIRATADGRDPTRTTVKEVMTPDVVWVSEDQDVRDAADTMAARRRYPVPSSGSRRASLPMCAGAVAHRAGSCK